ncbi:acyltransferase family protein [Actinopolyspora sp. BKK1]|nr:acyltransferase family protein [Actinopolyspora sp. BKK2]NHE78508.1 acyltransferase family protein [Actinopolyspora sp. BKK1]
MVGIVMLFTLSGYLITGVLTKELATRGRIDYRRFYLRRARRLLPALLVMIVVFVVVTTTLAPLDDGDSQLPVTVVTLLTFTGNLPIIHLSGAVFHCWTQATEEQFYLIWPALLALAWPRQGHGRARGHRGGRAGLVPLGGGARQGAAVPRAGSARARVLRRLPVELPADHVAAARSQGRGRTARPGADHRGGGAELAIHRTTRHAARSETTPTAHRHHDRMNTARGNHHAGERPHHRPHRKTPPRGGLTLPAGTPSPCRGAARRRPSR